MSSETTLPPPEQFDGKMPPVRQFLNKLKIRFAMQREKFSTEESKVMYLLTLLNGRAFLWASTLLDRSDPALQTIETFMTALLATFDEPDRKQTAINRMNALRQGSESVADYAQRFKEITSILTWQEEPLVNAFRLGLAPRIKNEFGTQDPPSTLAEMITIAVRTDHRLQERAHERIMEEALSRATAETVTPPPSKPITTTLVTINPNAMEVDATQQRKGTGSEWICHYCKKPGHFIAECRKRLAKERLKTKGQSPQ
jgi:Ty3 transposon capsid-like protein